MCIRPFRGNVGVRWNTVMLVMVARMVSHIGWWWDSVCNVLGPVRAQDIVSERPLALFYTCHGSSLSCISWN